MISADMKIYEYYTYNAADGYGQKQLSETPQGTIKLSIYTTSQSVQDNINYKGANYIALTYDKAVNDTYAIKYTDQKLLKVLYVNTKGRYTQVYLAEI